MSPQSATITVMAQAARKVARRLKRDFGELENLQVSRKGPADFVTTADMTAEKKLVEELSHARPGYGFLVEERGEIKGTDASHRWIIDPLDGTTNFMHAIPHFAISIALERSGVIVAGLIYNPVTDEMFTAERGQGAFLNDRRLRVSARRDLSQAVVATGLPFMGQKHHEVELAELQAVMLQTAGVRRFGSAALDLAFVAAGRFDAYWEHALNPWDIAAGILMVREAGGFVTDLAGGDKMIETGDILASNDGVQRPLTEILREASKKVA
jgi:myo-inositol-1(or 4)-monophosphatase